MAAAGPDNASFPAAAGPVPPAVAVELWPSTATQLAEEVAAELGLVANATTTPQASSRGGTPGALPKGAVEAAAPGGAQDGKNPSPNPAPPAATCH